MDRRELIRVIETFLDEVRKVDGEMQLQQMLCFLETSKRASVPYADIMVNLGLPSGTISRNMAALSEFPGGKGLIRVKEDMNDRRRKIARLSPKGDNLINTVLTKVSEPRQSRRAS